MNITTAFKMAFAFLMKII